jgi:phenylalanyl-tRNA synthetase alpha subunit
MAATVLGRLDVCVPIFFNGRWLEVLGSGIIRTEILQRAQLPHVGWAFGMVRTAAAADTVRWCCC